MKTRLLLLAVWGLIGLGFALAQPTTTTGWNRVVVEEPRAAFSTLTGLESVSVVPATVRYTDAQGRTHQQVGVGQSPAGFGDLVQGVTFDNLGRPDRGYLPFAPTGGATGQLRLPTSTSVGAFYGNDTHPYAQTTYRPDGLVDQQVGPGQAWRSPTGRGVAERDAIAPANTVRYFTLNATELRGTDTNGANAVVVNTMTDEQGHQSRTYTDRDGLLLLKQVQDDAGWQSTAYGYDELNRLVVIVPPVLYDQLATSGWQLARSDVQFEAFAFAFVYDTKGRLVEQLTPGGGWTYQVYNRRGERVMHQDARQRAINQWNFTKYDPLGRVALQGHYETTTSRAGLQGLLDQASGPAVNYETRVAPNLGTYATYWYTSNTYPYVQINDIDHVFYYDNYDWLLEFPTAPTDPNNRNVAGQLTGHKSRILGTNSWLNEVTYYDELGRPDWQVNKQVLGGTNETRLTYNFADEITQTQTVYRQPNKPDVTVTTRFEYDPTGRRTATYHRIGAGAEQTLATYRYDAVGRLVQKKTGVHPGGETTSQQTGEWPTTGTWQGGRVPQTGNLTTFDAGHVVSIPAAQSVGAGKLLFSSGSTLRFEPGSRLWLSGGNGGSPTLQTIDYHYDVRGSLRSINGDGAGNTALNQAQNDLFSLRLDYQQDDRYYNGLLSRQSWQTASGDRPQRSYLYSYDAADRLTNAAYSGVGSEAFSVGQSYDRNGNINTLTRQGLTGSSTGGRYGTPTSFGITDQLTYYTTGNRLQSVIETAPAGLSANPVDFRGGATYDYYPDGSLKTSANKGISLIEYNQLSLPQAIRFSGGDSVAIRYDAQGTRLSRTIYRNGQVAKTIAYVGAARYEGDTLVSLETDEGRAVLDPTTSQYIYEYQYHDHLGNLRLTYRAGPDGKPLITQETHYDPWGVELVGITTPSQNPDLFQGKERQEEFGLLWDDFGARQYDPQLGRWHSPDPANQFASPFVGMGNNPMNLVDPDGKLVFLAAVGIGAAVSALFYTGKTAFSNGGFRNWNWGQFGLSTLSGAIGGAVSFGIGGAFPVSKSFESIFSNMLAHGVSGAAQSAAFGGNAGQGFLSGFVSAGLSSGAGLAGLGDIGQLGAGGLGGGFSRVLAGGNFWDGVKDGLIVAGLNHLAHQVADPPKKKQPQVVSSESDENYTLEGYEHLIGPGATGVSWPIPKSWFGLRPGALGGGTKTSLLSMGMSKAFPQRLSSRVSGSRYVNGTKVAVRTGTLGRYLGRIGGKFLGPLGIGLTVYDVLSTANSNFVKLPPFQQQQIMMHQRFF